MPSLNILWPFLNTGRNFAQVCPEGPESGFAKVIDIFLSSFWMERISSTVNIFVIWLFWNKRFSAEHTFERGTHRLWSEYGTYCSRIISPCNLMDHCDQIVRFHTTNQLKYTQCPRDYRYSSELFLTYLCFGPLSPSDSPSINTFHSLVTKDIELG